MKYLFVLFWTLLSALPLHAETLRSVPLVPLHHGYAFDNPRVLTQQRLFGLAHGVALLAATCVREPAYRETLTPAYAEWQERQEATIAASYRDLARYYFRDRALEATQPDIARALGLNGRLSLKQGSKDMHAACDTLAEALRKLRLDLRSQYRLLFFAARLDAATAVEAEAESCHALLVDATQLNEALLLWRTTYGDGIMEAKVALEQQWPESRNEATLDESLAQAREDGKRRAVAQRCKAMTQWLLTRKSDPDDAFNTEP